MCKWHFKLALNHPCNYCRAEGGWGQRQSQTPLCLPRPAWVRVNASSIRAVCRVPQVSGHGDEGRNEDHPDLGSFAVVWIKLGTTWRHRTQTESPREAQRGLCGPAPPSADTHGSRVRSWSTSGSLGPWAKPLSHSPDFSFARGASGWDGDIPDTHHSREHAIMGHPPRHPAVISDIPPVCPRPSVKLHDKEACSAGSQQ